MSKAILGTKLGMSQVFAENGDLIPVSVIEVLPNVVAACLLYTSPSPRD